MYYPRAAVCASNFEFTSENIIDVLSSIPVDSFITWEQILLWCLYSLLNFIGPAITQ
jgi:hypothetical protein